MRVEKLAMRRKNPARKEWQMNVLNSLRLSYFLSPAVLKAKGIKEEPSPAHISRLLEHRHRLSKNNRQLPMLTHPSVHPFRLGDATIQAILSDVYERMADRMPFAISKHERFIVPSKEFENIWVNYNRKIIKAEKNFKRFLEKVVIFQNFELYKKADHSDEAYDPTAYRRLSKRERRRERELSDESIAQAIYWNSNYITDEMLEDVRTTRKRLKEYNLL